MDRNRLVGPDGLIVEPFRRTTEELPKAKSTALVKSPAHALLSLESKTRDTEATDHSRSVAGKLARELEEQIREDDPDTAIKVGGFATASEFTEFYDDKELPNHTTTTSSGHRVEFTGVETDQVPPEQVTKYI